MQKLRMLEATGIVLLTRKSPRRVLLLKHRNRWDLPKGHVEPGEDLTTAALRETEEETGIPASAIQIDRNFRWVTEYDVTTKRRGNYHKRVTYFLGWVDEPLPVTLTEHIDYTWAAWPVGPLQPQTIDPLLAAVDQYLRQSADKPAATT